MIARLLGELTTVDGRNIIGCLVVVPIVISCLHYHRYRFRRDKADRATVAEATEPLLSDQASTPGEDGEYGPFRNTSYNRGLGRFGETDDNLGFPGHNEKEEYDEEDDILEEEVVEITLDLGRMEGNIRRFFTRMHRVMI